MRTPPAAGPVGASAPLGAVPPAERPFERRDVLLYALTVFAWSASWYALKVNAASHVAAPVSTAWRFLGAALVMFAWVALAGERLRFPARTHSGFALLGVLLFSSNFILFYEASTRLVSGLLAVVFSLASVGNLLLGLARGDLAGPRRWFGAALGAGGIALLYWPEIAHGAASGVGLALCLCGTLSFCLGNQVSQALRERDVPMLPASAWGMAYGTLWSLLVAAALGHPIAFDVSVPYVGSLAFLTLVSTVLAFWAYLSLLGRIGAGRASYATVMFPVFALFVSTRLEGYVFTPLAALGIGCALAGNLFVLRGGRRRRPAPGPVGSG